MYNKVNQFPKSASSDTTHESLRKKRAEDAIKIRRTFLLRHIGIYPVCSAAVFFLSDAFVPVILLRAAMSLVLSVFPFLSIVSLMYEKRNALLRSQSKVLLQSLCTSVSGGYSLESAFLCARPTLEKAFGRRSLMAQALLRLEKSLSAHVPLTESLSSFCFRLDYVEILPIMHALSITRVVGSGVIGLLRNSCQMLSELMAVSSEVEANNAGRNAEAFILCLMPFGITYILSGFTGEYMSLTRKSPLGIFLMLTAFCFAVISCGFLLSLIGGKKKRTQMSVKIAKPVLPLPQNALKAIRRILYKTLPESYITRQFEFFSELSCEPEKFFELQIRKTVSVVLFTVPLFIILLHAAKYPVYPAIIAEFILVLLIHHEVSQKVRTRRENLMDEIPLFLSMIVTLLQSGVLLPKAIDTCSGAFSDTSTLGSEIQIMKSQILSGMSAGKAIESFSGRTPIPEAQAALLLASRFELTGGSEVLQLLSLQSTACWSLCRNASRKRRERDSLAMVLPMMLDLISVLLVASAPALISLKLK